ncbi:hypothetical protein PIB30_051820 [Stylosanthes scabra]|uniref:Aminotransferase-like plant mobile domain-containing protein n=1 Tax=Stylosanthes scabra TaxID=79078 RepID=A0ABU6WG45_9FABA|nr:hypothetical protein [Stylosanthes scabra]
MSTPSRWVRAGCDAHELPLRPNVAFSIVERWCPEMHSFHMSWDEVTITLQDVAYHIGLRTHGHPVDEAMRDFQMWYQHPTWGWVVELLGDRPSYNPKAWKESFSLKMTWLRQRMQ